MLDINKKELFVPWVDKSLPYIINFSPYRSGSTKLSNIFDAASKILGMKVFCYKSHPSFYPDLDINFSMVNNKMIIISSHRNILERTASYIRTKEDKNTKNFCDHIFVKSLDFCLSELKLEQLILESALRNQTNFYLVSYEYLVKTSPQKLLTDAVQFMSKVFNIDDYKTRLDSFVKDKKKLEDLVNEHGLTISAAKSFQNRFDGDFSLFDSKTLIHGNHISDDNNQFYKMFFSNKTVMYYIPFGEVIDNKNLRKLIEIARNKIDLHSISSWNYCK